MTDAGELVDGIAELAEGNEGKSVYVAVDWLQRISDMLQAQEEQLAAWREQAHYWEGNGAALTEKLERYREGLEEMCRYAEAEYREGDKGYQFAITARALLQE